MTDSLAAGEQAVRELLGLEMDVALHILEPFHGIARSVLQAKRFSSTIGLIRFECCGNVVIAPQCLHQADRIFTMGRAHAMQVAALVPSAAEKVSTLDPSGDIDDPIGGDTALYRDLAGQLETLIEKRLKEMKT